MLTHLHLRPLAARDSIATLTALVHLAYAPLAARGMNFTAATQSEATTRRRAAEGRCFVAQVKGEMVGTVTVCGPYDEATAPWAAHVPWFRDRDTAHFHQFAVHPNWQGQGVGRRLVAACEHWARESGFKHMALDTAEPAADLRALYQRLGYSDVGQIQWEGKTYRSVIMLKALMASPLRDHLLTMARYNQWATRALYIHVDRLPDETYRRDVGLFFKSIHGTLNHLLVGEHLLWFKRFAEGSSPLMALNAEVETDRDALRERLFEGALAWLPLMEVWPEEHLRGMLSYQRSDGQAMRLPFATTLAHVFNHGTHHRGQITAALTNLGQPGPELDLVRMLQEESAA